MGESSRGDFAHSLGLLILRLGAGGLMSTHGWGKLQMLLAGKFAEFGDPIGLGSGPSLVLVATAEFLGAVLVMLGLVTRLAALSVVVAMSVAVFVAHAADPWTMEEAYTLFTSGASKFPVSKEPALLFLVPFLCLTVAGGGRFSLDATMRRRRTAAAST